MQQESFLDWTLFEYAFFEKNKDTSLWLNGGSGNRNSKKMKTLLQLKFQFGLSPLSDMREMGSGENSSTSLELLSKNFICLQSSLSFRCQDNVLYVFDHLDRELFFPQNILDQLVEATFPKSAVKAFCSQSVKARGKKMSSNAIDSYIDAVNFDLI